MAEFDPSLPLERASTIPSSWYTDAAHFERECEVLFHTWQCAARFEQLQMAGQFVAFELHGEPILLIRGGDGVLRSFFNVCRHRAAPIAREPAGCVSKLRCQYHGWTYDFTGKLIGVPEFGGAECFDRADYGLVPAGTVAECGPWIWWTLNPKPIPPAETFQPFWNAVAFNGLIWNCRRIYNLNCNWKVYVDNYLDGGYHVHTIHPALAGAIDYATYRTDTFENCSVQSAPLTPAAGDVGNTRTGTAAYWWLWPNFMVNQSDGVMDTNWIVPLGVDRCRVIFDFYFAAQASPEFIESSLRVAERVQIEDVDICESVQCGLGSRAFDTGRFSPKRENGGYHFQRLLAAGLFG